MFVTRRAAAKQVERFGSCIPELVPSAWRNRNRVARLHFLSFAVNAQPSGALSDVINFFRLGMIMLLRTAADRHARFGQALIANGRIAMRQ